MSDDGFGTWLRRQVEGDPEAGSHDGMSSYESGALTAEAIRSSLDAMWNPRPRRLVLPPPELQDPTMCGAVLFAPDDSLIRAVEIELIATQTPVSPLDAPYFDPVQGPVPAACAREPHPDSPYHWDGRRTWWR